MILQLVRQTGVAPPISYALDGQPDHHGQLLGPCEFSL